MKYRHILSKSALAFGASLALASGGQAQFRAPRGGQSHIVVPPWPGARGASLPSIRPADLSPNPDWWRVFADPELDGLIARMHAGNTTILQSAARLAAARAQAHLGAAAGTPRIDLTGGASDASGPLINDAGGNGSLYTARVSVSWEVDLLGRLAGRQKAELLDAKAAEAMLRDAQLLMEAETARSYFETVYLQQAEASAAQQAALWQEREAIAAERARHGFAPEIDLSQLRQRSIVSAAEAAEISRQLAAARATLAFLVGESEPLTTGVTGLPAAPEVPSRLPSEVLARRFDIDAAASRVVAADSRLKSARRSWLPSFSLTASGGTASPTLGQILSASARDFGVGLLFSLPLFDGGRHKALVAGSEAERNLAQAQYRETVLGALREVNDALAAVDASGKQMLMADERQALGQREATIQQRRAGIGSISRAQLLESQIAASRQRQEALSAHFVRLVAAIDLIRAIGGGWAASSGRS